ncbi:hypothetical protein ACFOZ7_05705 [Natribaculum luteum]|uniref:Uncharacterized protein n=1 Tax=Natribaculum luteum TaxID=1586232 RepID=A0ABD5NX29_9EURY|nr:hypothetical protein [Natribaculum luteum]
MRNESDIYSQFMTVSLVIMIEISILGVVYLVVQLSHIMGQHLPLSYVSSFVILSVVLFVTPLLIQIVYDQEELLLFNIVVASWEANTADTVLWRRIQRNKAIKQAKKIDLPDNELPEEVVQLQQKEPRQIMPPLPGELGQFLHGAFLTLLRRPISVFWGWMIFGSLVVSLMIFVSTMLVGSLLNMLYKRYGAGEFYRRMDSRTRILLQNLTILYAHFLVLS